MRLHGRRGFSLIEMLFAIGIAMIIGGAIIGILVTQIQLTATQNRNIINQEDLRETMQLLTGEIAGDGRRNRRTVHHTANASELKFTGDLDGDGVPDQVEYVYAANSRRVARTLYSTDDGGATWSQVATDVLLHDVESFAFTYYAADNADPAGVLDAITAVELACALNTAGEATAFTSGKLAPQAMVARVTIRNRVLDSRAAATSAKEMQMRTLNQVLELLESGAGPRWSWR